MSDTYQLPYPAAHVYPSDLEKFETNETFAHCYSVPVGNPDERSVPLFTAEHVLDAHASGQAERDALKVELYSLKAAIKVKGGTEYAPTQWAYDKACEALRKKTEELARLQGDPGRYQTICSNGCGQCGVKLSEFEYYRSETLSGELVESRVQPRVVSTCCGSEVDVWDEAAQEYMPHNVMAVTVDQLSLPDMDSATQTNNLPTIQSAQRDAAEKTVIAGIPKELLENMERAEAAYAAKGGCAGCGSKLIAVHYGSCSTTGESL